MTCPFLRNIMQGLKDSFTDLKDNAGGLVDNYIKLAKVQVAEKSINALSLIIVVVLALFLMIFFLFFTGMALGIWIGNLLDNEIAGYLIIAGIYLLVAVILVAARRKLIFPFVAKSIIKTIYGQTDKNI